MAVCLGNLTAASPWPEFGRATQVCGTSWQEQYATLHSRLLTTAQPRLLVFDAAANGGLADRLTGLMTLLLIAMLTDRALAIDWAGFDAALSTPRIDTAAALALARRAPPNDVRSVRWLNANRLGLREQVEADLDTLWPERVLVFQSNRGFTQGLLTSTRHAAAAASRQLSPSTTQFGCLVDFLLRPTESALATLQPLRDGLAGAHAVETVTIGVHVRTGDASFAAEAGGLGGGGGAAERLAAEAALGAKLYASHAFIFDYAVELGQQLARTRSRAARASDEGGGSSGGGGAAGSGGGGEVGRASGPYFVLLGDSPALRRHAAALLGEQSVLYWGNATGSRIGHVARQPGNAATLQSAVAEHWLFAGCDAFVYSSHSGYPRTAAARALRDDALHTCFHYAGPVFNSHKRSTARECTGPWSVAELGERHAAGL